MAEFADWSKAQTVKAAPCWYRCGLPAWLVEPGTGRTAHKVCAELAAIREAGLPEPAAVDPLSIVGWDGEDRESKLEPRALGCGTPPPGVISGRVCGGTGGSPSCPLCPQSPTYWRRAGGDST